MKSHECLNKTYYRNLIRFYVFEIIQSKILIWKNLWKYLSSRTKEEKFDKWYFLTLLFEISSDLSIENFLDPIASLSGISIIDFDSNVTILLPENWNKKMSQNSNNPCIPPLIFKHLPIDNFSSFFLKKSDKFFPTCNKLCWKMEKKKK